MTALDVLAFLGELVLLAALAVAGARLGSGAAGVVLAVVLPVLLAVVWGRWLAPRAPHPVSAAVRLAVKTALVVATAALLALSGLPVPGGAVLVAVGAVFALAGRPART